MPEQKHVYAHKHLYTAGFLACALSASFSSSASPPPVGSDQWNMSRPYKDFIVNMRNKNGGSCCDLSDGRGDLEERELPDGRYQVKMTKKAYEHYDVKEEGEWIDVPPEAVLTATHANEVCKSVREANPTNNTCKAPPYNILWVSPYGHVYCYWPRPKIM